jgi:SAM-dependent methyltransferase
MPPDRQPPSVDLICPADAELLERADEGSAYRCPACGGRYPVEKGVVRFLTDTDAFYEGRYLNTIRFVPRRETPLRAWPLWQISSGWIWAARAHVPAGGTVVEIGCASGVAYFAHRYRMVGIDLSHASLARIAELYHTCLQADVTRAIPLPDASVDGIFSSFVWEHIPPDRKPRALAEMARVLRPGGKLVFLYDVESDNPLYRWMKRRDSDLYREVLIEREGHEGWQTPEENRALFEQHGFQVLEHRGKEKLLISPAMYDKVREFGGWMRPFAELGYRFKSAPLFYAYNGAVRVLDETLGAVLPTAWSRVMVSVCQKGRADGHR